MTPEIQKAMANYKLPARVGNTFAQEPGAAGIPFRTPKVLEEAYLAYAAECKAERIATWSFREWIKEGCLTLTEMRTKWRESYIAEMRARHGEDWQPETAEEKKAARSKSDKPAKVKRDNPNKGATKRVWAIADGLLSEATRSGKAADGYEKTKEFRAELVKVCVAQNIHPGTAQVQFSKWKKSLAG